ncbi:MAG: hypothetical protein PUF31_05135 [Oscillospiraceae bacterium]|nr:hypothetical protein [Oscillospiraceae bacterium]
MKKTKISEKVAIGVMICVCLVVLLTTLTVFLPSGKKENATVTAGKTQKTTVTEVSKPDESRMDSKQEYRQYIDMEYAPIIISFRNLIGHNSYKDADDGDDYGQYNEYVDPSLLEELQTDEGDGAVYYALNDFDHNGTPELFIGTKEESGYRLLDVFTYANGNIYKLMNEFEYIECALYVVCPSGNVMLISGEDGGADGMSSVEFYTFYHITENGHSVDVVGSLMKEGDTGYRYSVSGNKTKLDNEAFESAYYEYAGESFRNFEYNCARLALDWQLLKDEDVSDVFEEGKQEFTENSEITSGKMEETEETWPEITQEESSDPVITEQAETTEEETQSGSVLSMAEAEQKVLEYYNADAPEGGAFVVFEDETREDEFGYTFIVHFQSDDLSEPNVLVDAAYVDKATGVLQIDD